MIHYSTTTPLPTTTFIDLLRRSTLAERRPVDEAEIIAGMLANADLTVTAWDGDLLVGVARSVTDFTYCCYLSDLAVDVALSLIHICICSRSKASLQCAFH